jgi:type IV pilus assembly protein PilO
VFAVIGLVLGLLYWKFVFKALEDDLEAARIEHSAKIATNRRLAADIPEFAELRARMTRLRELIEKNQTALPSQAELPAFFDTLQQKIAESGVEMHRWTNRSEEPIESFVKVPVEIEITGTFMQIKRFFASLVQQDVRASANADRASEEHERIVSVENLTLGTPTVKNREIILDAKFIAVTFRQEDKPAATAKGPNGQPAAPGARPAPSSRPAAAPPPPSTPTPAPPPLPSAATPAGAKARVDKASEKADARTRNSPGVEEAKPGAGSDRLKGGL